MTRGKQPTVGRGASGAAPGSAAPAERATLFGRDDEIARIVGAIRADRCVAVMGEAGIGKTSVVRAAVAASGRTLREGGGFATLAWMPNLALQRAVGVHVSGDRAGVAAEVERLVGPDVLFVDDLQWADPDTLAVLELLVGRIIVVVAIREGDAGERRATAAMDRAGTATVRLGPLGPGAAEAIARQRRPGLSARLLADVVRQAGGNPLLVEEFAASGRPSPVLQRSLTQRAAGLSPPAHDLVRLLAVAERPLQRYSLGPAVDEGIAAGLLVDHAGWIDIRHVLVASAIRDGLTPAAMRRLHLRLAELSDHRGQAARHLVAAGRRKAAADAAMEALATLEASVDPRERAALLVLAAETASPTAALGLRLEAARILDEVAEWAAVMRVLEDVQDRGSAEDQVERDAILAHAAFALGDVERSRTHIAAAAGRSIDQGSRAAVRRSIETATLLVNADGAVSEALAELDQTIAGPVPGDEATRELEVLRASIRLLAGRSAAEMATVQTAADDAFEAGRFRSATDLLRVIQYLLLMGAGSDAALGFLKTQAARFAATGLGSPALEFHADAVVAACLAGRPGEAVRLADELLEQPAPARARQTAEIHRARALTILGRFEAAEAALTALARVVSGDFLGLGELLAAQADLALWSGRPAKARDLTGAALAIPPPVPFAHGPLRLTEAWALVELDLPPVYRLEFALPPSLQGAKPELDGLAQLHAGDHGGAAAAFALAASTWSGFHAQRALVCGWAAGEALRRAGNPDAAVERLHAALADAMAIGFEPLAARARRSLRLAGVRVPAGASREASGSPGLTAREAELVRLVERGLSNVEIARRLGLGRPTVARMLTSAMGKLGVQRRTQLAARELV